VNVSVARTLEEVESLRPVWERLEGEHINSDMDFYMAHVRHAPQVVRPHVVLVEEGGEPAGLAVGRLENARSPTRLGYAMVFNPHVRSLTVVYGGLLAADSNVSTLVEAVRGSLARREADVVRIRMLRLGSPAYDVARADAPFLRREHFRKPVTHWRSTIPGSLEEFLAARSKERRRHVRRYARKLEESCGGEVEVGRFHSRDELERLFADTHDVYQRTYRRPSASASPAATSTGGSPRPAWTAAGSAGTSSTCRGSRSRSGTGTSTAACSGASRPGTTLPTVRRGPAPTCSCA
jgi:hypothetical protein